MFQNVLVMLGKSGACTRWKIQNMFLFFLGNFIACFVIFVKDMQTKSPKNASKSVKYKKTTNKCRKKGLNLGNAKKCKTCAKNAAKYQEKQKSCKTDKKMIIQNRNDKKKQNKMPENDKTNDKSKYSTTLRVCW